MKIYEGLIKRNPENHAYYHGQATARHADSAEQKLELFAKAREQYPRAQAPQRLALDVAKGRPIQYMNYIVQTPIPFLGVEKIVPMYITLFCRLLYFGWSFTVFPYCFRLYVP